MGLVLLKKGGEKRGGGGCGSCAVDMNLLSLLDGLQTLVVGRADSFVAMNLSLHSSR